MVLTGTISTGQGQITFNWDFGNVSSQGQIVEHTFPIAGEYPITLTVTGPACPVARAVVAITTLTVGQQSAGGTGTIFLPVILKSSIGGTASITSGPETSIETPSPSPESEIGLFVLDNDSGAPTQVKGLQGVQSGPETISLTWNSGPPHDAILGYRVYRSAAGTASFKRLADLPASMANYTDSTATCGQSYFVTAYNASGESLPSTSSYFSLPCP
jgi:PKD repeat protein